MLGDASFRALLQIFGYAWPGYLCYKTVERRENEKLKLWCMYWVLMAAFTAIQPIADTFLFLFPLYYSAKLAFACYLWANNLAGAELIYTRYARPFITQYEPLIDAKIAEGRVIISELVTSNFARGVQWLQARVVSALAAAQAATVNNNNSSGNHLRAEPAGEAAPAAGAFKSYDSFKSASSALGPRGYTVKDE